MNEFVGVERKALEAFNAAVTEAQAGRLTDAAFADRLEQDILPPWRSIRAQIDGLVDDRAFRQRPEWSVLMSRYLATRQQAWEAYAQALRRNDAEAMAMANQKSQEADALVRQLQELSHK